MQFNRAVWLASALALLPACGSGAQTEARTAVSADTRIDPVAVPEAQFAESAGRLLLDGDINAARIGLLVGVVQRQLARASARFESGHPEEGLAATIGALYLVRAGEYHPDMVKGGETAILRAAEAVAHRGNEGQALALYSMLRGVLPEGARRTDVDEHLRALATWKKATRGDRSLEASGEEQRVAVERSLLEPTGETLRVAHEATLTWVSRAIEAAREQLLSADPMERMEAGRAHQSGPIVLAALYLRHGDAESALSAIEQADVARVTSNQLHDLLRRAAGERDPDAFFDLFKNFDSFFDQSAPGMTIDRELARAASWGTAVELYRIEPTTMRGIMPVATWLMRHAMPEVAVPMLRPIVSEAEPDPRALSWALSYVLQAIVDEDSALDLSAARRIFEGAAPLLQAASKPGLKGQVTPSVARIEYVMGAIEARAGELSRARALLSSSAKTEPTVVTLRLLSSVDRARGASMDALAALEKVVALATAASDPVAVAEAQTAIFEVQRDTGNVEAAKRALDQALRRALDARELARGDADQAAAERVLARVLEMYDEQDGARRAMERAFEASQSDSRQLTATVLEASRRALTRGDLKAARDAARRALEAKLPDEDLVYVALWLKLVEDRLKVPSDGTTEEALSTIDGASGWASKLRAWGSGRLDDEGLYRAAKSRVEQTEALFYTTMARRAAGTDAEVVDRLKVIASSAAIQLVEVTIARDLVAGAQSGVRLELPKDVQVP